MALRFWLTVAGVNAAETTEEEEKYSPRLGRMIQVIRLMGFKVQTDETGASYIDTGVDPMSPTNPLPKIDRKYFKSVSFWGTYCSGIRPDGLYRLKGATALVQKRLSLNGNGSYQEIQISAGSVRTLREIYTQVRKGELEPAEKWSHGG